jgi:hypothetical protein
MDERADWRAPLAWIAATVVLIVLGVVDEVMWTTMAVFTGGVAVTLLYRMNRARLTGKPYNVELEHQVRELEARLTDAEAEIVRLKNEVDFDRQLLRSGDDNPS